jgi:peptidyl-tRNA hydrolase
VDNNGGNNFRLKLIDAPTEEEVLERRAREFEAAERGRLAQISAAEAEIAAQIDKERREVEKEAMHEWWRARRAVLRKQAEDLIASQMSGNVDGCVDSIDVRARHRQVDSTTAVVVSISQLLP